MPFLIEFLNISYFIPETKVYWIYSIHLNYIRFYQRKLVKQLEETSYRKLSQAAYGIVLLFQVSDKFNKPWQKEKQVNDQAVNNNNNKR